MPQRPASYYRAYRLANRDKIREQERKRWKKRSKQHQLSAAVRLRGCSNTPVRKKAKAKHKAKAKEELPPYRVADYLRINVSDLTPEIYEVAKLKILLKRELKTRTEKTNEHASKKTPEHSL